MKTLDQIFEKIEKVKNEEHQEPGLSRTRSGTVCLIIGGITGLMLGYSKKWNLFYSAIGGSVIGAAIGSIFVPKQ